MKRLGGALAATALAWHAGPALTSIGPLRTRLTPALAGVGDPGHVALTFDDGPHPLSTPRFLEVLDRLGVRATFFLLGRWAARAPGLVKEITGAGHEIGLHGYDHRCLLLRGPRATYTDLARGWASAATRNLFSLVSILSRMILSSLGCELRWVGATLP